MYLYCVAVSRVILEIKLLIKLKVTYIHALYLTVELCMGHNYTEETDRNIIKNRHDSEGAIIVSICLSIILLIFTMYLYTESSRSAKMVRP